MNLKTSSQADDRANVCFVSSHVNTFHVASVSVKWVHRASTSTPSWLKPSSFSCVKNSTQVQCALAAISATVASGTVRAWYLIPSKHDPHQRRQTSFALLPSQALFHVRARAASQSAASAAPHSQTWCPSLSCSATCRSCRLSPVRPLV